MNSKKVCVDASLALIWLLISQQNDRADALRREWREEGVELVGPPLFHAEVTSAIRRQVHFKRISPEEGDEAFSISLDIPVRIIDERQVYRRAWELAREFSLPHIYDMQYVAVAELHDCDLWTADKRLVNSLRGSTGRVRWLGEYKIAAAESDII